MSDPPGPSVTVFLTAPLVCAAEVLSSANFLSLSAYSYGSGGRFSKI